MWLVFNNTEKTEMKSVMELVLEEIQDRSGAEILVRNLLPKASAAAGALVGNAAVSKKIDALEDRRDKAKTKYEKDQISKQIRRLQVVGVLAGGAIGGVGVHHGTKLAYGDYRDKTPTWTPRVPGPKPQPPSILGPSGNESPEELRAQTYRNKVRSNEDPIESAQKKAAKENPSIWTKAENYLDSKHSIWESI